MGSQCKRWSRDETWFLLDFFTTNLAVLIHILSCPSYDLRGWLDVKNQVSIYLSIRPTFNSSHFVPTVRWSRMNSKERYIFPSHIHILSFSPTVRWPRMNSKERDILLSYSHIPHVLPTVRWPRMNSRERDILLSYSHILSFRTDCRMVKNGL